MALTRVLAVIALIWVVGLAPQPWAAPQASQPISDDPYADGGAQHATQTDPDTFAWGHTIVAAFQTGRYFNGGASNIGWATSTDGGQTWRQGFLPSLTVASEPPGVAARASDPAVAYARRHGVWLISSLTIGGGNRIATSRSVDGQSWGPPIELPTGSGYDKNWIVCDNWPTSPYYGRGLYLDVLCPG